MGLEYNRISQIWKAAEAEIGGDENLIRFEDFYPGHETKQGPDILSTLRPFDLEGKNFLDLGAQSGWALTLADLGLGMIASGIEAWEDAVLAGNKKLDYLRSIGVPLHPKSQIYFGNFFPDDCDATYKEKWNNVVEIPQALLNTNPYEDMQMTLRDFAVIYCFQYSSNTPAIIRLLSEENRCASGTLIIIPTSIWLLRDMVKTPLPNNLTVLSSKYASPLLLQVQ